MQKATRPRSLRSTVLVGIISGMVDLRRIRLFTCGKQTPEEGVDLSVFNEHGEFKGSPMTSLSPMAFGVLPGSSYDGQWGQRGRIR